MLLPSTTGYSLRSTVVEEESPVEEENLYIEEENLYTEEELTSLTNAELKSICDELGIKHTSSATKATLVSSILEAQGGN